MKVQVFAILLLIQISCINEMTNFDYKKHGEDWGNDCNNQNLPAHQQSPIPLSINATDKKHDDSYLFCEFSAVKGIANYLNTTIYVNTSTSFGNSYTYLIDQISVPFKAAEMRIRVHSQHQIENNYYDLQLQIFHTELYPTSRNLKFAISLLFNASTTADPFLQQIIENYQNGTKSAEINADLSHLLTKNNIDDFWFYKGSLTLPPCRNGQLYWLVSKTVHSLTQEQLDSITSILNKEGRADWPGNWRKLQSISDINVGFRKLSSEYQL